MYPPAIQKLIEQFSQFPTIGPRTAARFAFYILKAPVQRVNALAQALVDIGDKIALCEFCFNPFEKEIEKENNLCAICQNPSRDKTLLCVVEKENDLESLEKTKEYRGLYFILGGIIGMFTKEEMKHIRIEELKERIQNPERFGISSFFKEVIVALNPTTEGEATALYMERTLNPIGIPVTRLARGLPMEGELEYADEETLRHALKGRR